jgi:hypothetical protein
MRRLASDAAGMTTDASAQVDEKGGSGRLEDRTIGEGLEGQGARALPTGSSSLVLRLGRGTARRIL